MANLTEFLRDPETLTVAALVLVLVFVTALVFSALLGRQRRLLEQLQDISNSVFHLQESFVRTNLNLGLWRTDCKIWKLNMLKFRKIMNLVR